MKILRPLYWVAGTAGAVIVFLFLALFLVPDRDVQDLAARLAEREGYGLRATKFGMAFPIGLKAADLTISSDKGPLLNAKKASIRLRLLPLLTGKVSFGFRFDIGAGTVNGAISPNGGFAVDAAGIRLEDIPAFQTVAGASVKGGLWLSGSMTGGEKGKETGGEVRLEVKDANVSGVKIGEIPLPDADYSTVQGMIRRKGSTVLLESFTLQGEGLYVRLKGNFPLTTPVGAAPLDLALELMPKPDLLEKQKFVFLLLAKYLVSPGSYLIPVRGTLAKPLIQ